MHAFGWLVVLLRLSLLLLSCLWLVVLLLVLFRLLPCLRLLLSE